MLLIHLGFASNPWDSKFVTMGSDSAFGTFTYRFAPKNITNIKKGTGFQFSYSFGANNFFRNNCIGSDCFIRINNSMVTLPEEPGTIPGFAFYFFWK